MEGLLAVLAAVAVGSAAPAHAEDAPLQPLALTAPGATGLGATGPATAGSTAVRGAPASPLGNGASVAHVARGPELAAALAARLGMAYQDAGSHVLLTDGLCRVRVYPNSNRISLDGQDLALRGLMARNPQGVMIPAPAASLIHEHVLAARVARRPAPPPPVLAVSAAPAAPAAAPKPRPAAKPVPAPSPAAAPAAQPDPSWVVAPTDRAWKWIILHHSDDLSGNLAKYHQGHLDRGWEHGCGYHFVIGNGSLSKDGQVEVSQRWTRQLQGAHAKTPDNRFNDHGVGIVLVGDFEKGSGRPTAAQMRSLVRLTQWLMDRYQIGIADVRGHCHCKATCCPGKNFPWGELRLKLREPAATKAATLPGRTAQAPAAAVPAVPAVPAAHVAAVPAPGASAARLADPVWQRPDAVTPSSTPPSSLPPSSLPPAAPPPAPKAAQAPDTSALGAPPAGAVPPQGFGAR